MTQPVAVCLVQPHGSSAVEWRLDRPHTEASQQIAAEYISAVVHLAEQTRIPLRDAIGQVYGERVSLSFARA